MRGALALAAVIAAGSATVADAAAVAPTTPCVRYIPGVPSLGLTAAGWAPGAALSFKVAGRSVGSGTADASGAFATPALALFSPPPPKGNVQSVKLTATDGAGTTASHTIKLVRLTVDVPARAGVRQRVSYRAFGFLPGKRLYLFIRRNGKTKGRFVLGRPKGACGRLTKTLPYMPLKRWSAGSYEYLYLHSRKYRAKQVIYGYDLKISRG